MLRFAFSSDHRNNGKVKNVSQTDNYKSDKNSSVHFGSQSKLLPGIDMERRPWCISIDVRLRLFPVVPLRAQCAAMGRLRH